MSVQEDFADYKVGKLDLAQLAEKWAGLKWKARGPMPTTDPVVVWEEADEVDYFQAGTWGEVEQLWATGQLTDDEYFFVSAAVDGRRSSG